MSDVLLTSLLEDKKSFFQVSLTNELLSWVRVVSPDGGAGGGWGQAQHLKQRESILASSPSAVTTDINSRRTVMTSHVLGVSTYDHAAARSRWAKKKKEQHLTASENGSLSASCSYSDASFATGASDAASKATSGDARHGAVATSKTDSYLTNSSSSFSPSHATSSSSLRFHVHVARPTSNRKWRYATYTFSCFDTITCLRWVNAIRDILVKIDESRPRRLLVLVNPYGGKGRGPKIFLRHVKPIFDLALIKSTVIETQYRGHAADIVSHVDLSSVDGVVAVGGDGTFNEIANALIRRVNTENKVDVDDPESQLRSLDTRVGIIPCGSTDCMAFSTMGNNDAITCAIHTVLGKSLSLDVASVHHNRQLLRYSLTFMGYGYYGDVLLNSEKYRSLGPGRYNLAGFQKLVTFGSYEGEVSFLPCESPSHPGDGNVCYSDCKVCGERKVETTEQKLCAKTETSNQSLPVAPSSGETISSSATSSIPTVTTAVAIIPASAMARDASIDIEQLNLNLESSFPRATEPQREDRRFTSSLPPPPVKPVVDGMNEGSAKMSTVGGEVNAGFDQQDVVGASSFARRPTSMSDLQPKKKLPAATSSPFSSRLSNDWITVQGKFIGVNCIMMSARCGLCPDGLSPFGHLSDGCMDLMLASKCSRLTYLRHLINCARPNVNQLKFGFIDVIRVKAFKFRPMKIQELDDDLETRDQQRCRTCGDTTPTALAPPSYPLPTLSEGEGGGGTSDNLTLIPAEEAIQTPSPGCATCLCSSSSFPGGKSGGNAGGGCEGGVEQRGQRTHCWQDVKTSVWNCDGETIHDPAVEVKMHRKVLHMFGSGIPDPHDTEAVTQGCEDSQSDCYDFSSH